MRNLAKEKHPSGVTVLKYLEEIAANMPKAPVMKCYKGKWAPQTFTRLLLGSSLHAWIANGLALPPKEPIVDTRKYSVTIRLEDDYLLFLKKAWIKNGEDGVREYITKAGQNYKNYKTYLNGETTQTDKSL